MPLFRQNTAEIASPRDVGKAHMLLCGEVCEGVDAMSTDLNRPLQAATDALPKEPLLEWDNDPPAIQELLGGWQYSIPRTSLHQRYIFGNSIFNASFDAGARGILPRSAVVFAVEALETLSMNAIEGGRTGFGKATGYEQLDKFGKALGDYRILSAAAVVRLLAELRSQSESSPSNDMDQVARGILVMQLREHAENYIRLAREQYAHNERILGWIDRYEEMSRTDT